MQLVFIDITGMGPGQRREAVRGVLAARLGVAAADLPIEKAGKGKPYIPGNPIFHSVSHSFEKMVVAMADRPVGVDLEYMRARDFAAIAKHRLGEAKAREIMDSADPKRAFYAEWTRFEAAGKLFGEGIFSQKKLPAAKISTEFIEGGYALSTAE